MTDMQVLEIVRMGVQTVLLASAPPLLLGLIVGVTVSIFQTITSIQEPTLAFVPKIIAVFLSLIIFGTFMLSQLSGFMKFIFENIVFYLTT